MDIQSINDDINTRQWIERIKECRKSGLPVRRWCRQNNICEQTYYCWLRKLRKMAIESGAVKAPSFVSVDQSTLDKQNIVITKGDVLIEFPFDYSRVIAPVVADLCTTPVALSAPPNSFQNNSQS